MHIILNHVSNNITWWFPLFLVLYSTVANRIKMNVCKKSTLCIHLFSILIRKSFFMRFPFFIRTWLPTPWHTGTLFVTIDKTVFTCLQLNAREKNFFLIKDPFLSMALMWNETGQLSQKKDERKTFLYVDVHLDIYWIILCTHKSRCYVRLLNMGLEVLTNGHWKHFRLWYDCSKISLSFFYFLYEETICKQYLQR